MSDPRGQVAVDFLRSIVGTPYLWRGKDQATGLDCSGAVMLAWEKAGTVPAGARKRYASADLYAVLRSTSTPQPGDLAFYGKDGGVAHVMMVVGDGRVIGASGGGRQTVTTDIARQQGAYVKYKPTVKYRDGFIGFGAMPAPGEKLAPPPPSPSSGAASGGRLAAVVSVALLGVGLAVWGLSRGPARAMSGARRRGRGLGWAAAPHHARATRYAGIAHNRAEAAELLAGDERASPPTDESRPGRPSPHTGFPIMHGWAVIGGKVADVTLRNTGARACRRVLPDRVLGAFPDGSAYLGVLMDRSLVLDYMRRYRALGSLIDDWQGGFPLLLGQ